MPMIYKNGPLPTQDQALKMVRVGDVLARNGRLREACAVYRRAALAFERERRMGHARGAWRLVLRVEPMDEQARTRIVDLGGLPTSPEVRTGFQTKVREIERAEVEPTMVGDEMWEITDPGVSDEDPEAYEKTLPWQPESTVPGAPAPDATRISPVGFVDTVGAARMPAFSVDALLEGLDLDSDAPEIDLDEFTAPSEPTET